MRSNTYRPSVGVAVVLAALVATPGVALAQACTADQFSAAVDQAGAALRGVTRQNQPKLEQKLKALQQLRGWADPGAEDKAFEEIADARTAALDRTANELLARIDTLGQLPINAVPECGRLQELEAASLELQAAVKTKSAYMLNRIDTLLAGNAKAAETPAAAQPVVAAVPAVKVPQNQAAATAPPPPPPVKASPPRGSDQPWSTTTNVEAPAVTAQPTPPAQTADTPSTTTEVDGYTIDEIVRTSDGFFGKVSANLGSVVEYAFRKSGRPAGYILGNETGGAFLAGLRYGSGTLYLRSGGTMPIHWHGPSLGADVGAQGSKIMFLVYRLSDPEQLWSSFSSVEGSAFLAGGVGFTLMTNGAVQMAPIRSGVGLRLGASLGYIRFTRRPTWNPF
jgi:hypothetical protein